MTTTPVGWLLVGLFGLVWVLVWFNALRRSGEALDEIWEEEHQRNEKQMTSEEGKNENNKS